MTKIILNPKDIALIVESLIIIAAVIAMIIQEIKYRLRLRRIRRAKEQEPAIRAARRAKNRKRFEDIMRETTYSIEAVPCPPARKPKA